MAGQKVCVFRRELIYILALLNQNMNHAIAQGALAPLQSPQACGRIAPAAPPAEFYSLQSGLERLL
ncbi:hypothetical protein NIES2130_34955 [Scytonema sp. HK-05]|nr:hypothetical protein NIES2130_34955 [Scytonema sp. HK-05]